MEQINNLVLGAGISGLSCAFHLNKKKQQTIICEASNDWGGLCGNFSIQGFRFDKFVHFSFTENEYVKNLFTHNLEILVHKPELTNFYYGKWLKHPAQNNLQCLNFQEKVKIFLSFLTKPHITPTNYDEWLRVQYGNYFAEHFPMNYTRKYWGLEAKELETKWVGKRMRPITIKEMLQGLMHKKQKTLYYAKNMRYPQKGGFKSFLSVLAQKTDIRLNKKAVKINPTTKEVFFADGSRITYRNLISTIPLPEVIKLLPNVPASVQDAARKLRYTCGYMVSVALKKPYDFKGNLLFYVYDKEIPFARVYFPSIKSPDNVPAGASSLQAEIFFANDTPVPNKEMILTRTIQGLLATGIIQEKDILFTDIRFEPYANVIFDLQIYNNRKIVLDYLKHIQIIPAGRFGTWEYLWTDQCVLNGKNVAEQITGDNI